MRMKESYAVPLHGRVAGGNDIEFVEAELSTKYDVPFALVRYTLQGKKQKTGLRLDLDKQAFIDHFEGDPEREKTLVLAAPEIVKILGTTKQPAPGKVYTRTK
jgi:hypothetical protein